MPISMLSQQEQIRLLTQLMNEHGDAAGVRRLSLEGSYLVIPNCLFAEVSHQSRGHLLGD
jgi:predicted ArsR family transcriptional regulator